MPNEILVALLGLFGVTLSAVVSWLVSRHQVSVGIRKIQLEMQQVYAERLHDARMIRYESDYAAIERIAKAVQRPTIPYQNYREFCNFLDD